MENSKNVNHLAYLFESLGLFIVTIFLAFTEIFCDCSVLSIHPYYTMLLLISLVPIPFILFFQKFAKVASIVCFAGVLVTVLMLFINRNTVVFWQTKDKPEGEESYKSYVTANVSVVFYGEQKEFVKDDVSNISGDDKKEMEKKNKDIFDTFYKELVEKSKSSTDAKKESRSEKNQQKEHDAVEAAKPEDDLKKNVKVYQLVSMNTVPNIDLESQMKDFCKRLNSIRYSKLGKNLLILIKLDGHEKMDKLGFNRKFSKLKSE